ncbi:hypothetical protein GCM10023185_39070 [Hymenobacter saemangeumensis]|uniref:DUF2141 domain-containing protein n=1 Tax=Hymenobacter saemangeumensis TaxID=1084522 RepID=A0ABP8IRR2_9BACT
MKVFALSFLLVGSSLLGAAVPAANTPTATASVTVVVSSLASPHSTVKLYFYNKPSGFLKAKQYTFMKAVNPGGQHEIALPVELTPGDWAVAITQDLNNNDKLDKNFIGIPTEPFAFSNNVRPTVAPPNFDECKFRVEGHGKVVSIKLK